MKPNKNCISCFLPCLALLTFSISTSMAAELVVTESTTLDPKENYTSIVVQGSNIVIDGNGAKITGDMTLPGNKRAGIGLKASGVSNVTIKNLSIHGFETGIQLTNCSDCRLENCDASDNFTDPDFGWGENGHRGGIIVTDCERIQIAQCKANRNWDGCLLLNSEDCSIVKNDFSKCSNVCLSLWGSLRNTITDNNLSYGLRITPGEVHARDSTSVLLESGSCDNRFVGNDCTHGGDGIFVRSLSGLTSTRNYFESNDCSYANNNGFECWSPDNTFIKNKANHCSYGFWMGGSNGAVLIENEASFNGMKWGFHNSPHLPDNRHAGIVFMFGAASHLVLIGNKCVGNEGAGIALIGDEESKGRKFRPFHCVIESNYLPENRWGLYLQFADWIYVANNHWPRCGVSGYQDAGGNQRIETVNNRDSAKQPTVPNYQPVSIDGPQSVAKNSSAKFQLGKPAAEDLSQAATVQWVKSPGESELISGSSSEFRFDETGTGSVSVIVIADGHASLANHPVTIFDNQPEFATETSVTKWSDIQEEGLEVTFSADKEHRIVGNESLLMLFAPYHGQRARVEYPTGGGLDLDLSNAKRLFFWIHPNNPNQIGFQYFNPEIVFYDKTGRSLRFIPNVEILNRAPSSSLHSDWIYVSIPLDGDAVWKRDGEPIKDVDHFTLGFDSWGGDPFRIWIDGMGIE